MDKLLDNLMERIFIESDFPLIKFHYDNGKFDFFSEGSEPEIKDIEGRDVEGSSNPKLGDDAKKVEKYSFSTSVYIAQNLQSDYFIYLHIPENLLRFVSNDIQIKLSSLIKGNDNDFEKVSAKGVKISSSFDKNATLIIFTTHDVSVKNNVMKKAISIEEDPYFFKKQVLLISEKDIPIIASNFDEHKNSYIAYIQNLISDTERFNEFTSLNMFGLTDKGTEYSFVAKLYEKLPFLALLVAPSNQEVLQHEIDRKLTEEQFVECEKLLELDVNNLEGWFSELVKEEVND